MNIELASVFKSSGNKQKKGKVYILENVRKYEVYEDRFVESKKKIQKAIDRQRKMNKVRKKIERMVICHIIGLLFAGSTATLMIPELIEARGYFAFGGEWMLFGVFYIIGYLGMKYINERGTEQ